MAFKVTNIGVVAAKYIVVVCDMNELIVAVRAEELYPLVCALAVAAV